MTKVRTHIAPGYTTDDVVQTGGAPTDLSADGTLSADSDALVPTQKAVKTYVDAHSGGGGGGGSGTVTSVDLSASGTGLTTSGGPVTGSGTLSLSGTLNETHGGTNQTSYTKGDTLAASGTNTLAKLGVGADGFVKVADSNASNGLAWYDSPVRPGIKSGRYVTTPNFTTLTTKTLGANNIYFAPVYVKKRTAFTHFGFATVAVTAGSYKTGVYADNNGAPTGTPVTNSTVTVGPFTTSAATAQAAAFSSAITLNAGWYWLALLPDTNGSVNAASGSCTMTVLGVSDMGNTGPTLTYSQSYASGMPDMTSNSMTYAENAALPYLGLKVQ